MNIARRVICIGLTATLFVIVCRKLNFMYVIYDPYNRIMFHSYYGEDNIDNLFLGSSHLYCDVNPYLLDELNGKNNFNLGTSGQRWDMTYYLLKDALSRNKVENVYIECYYAMAVEYEAYDKGVGDIIAADYIDQKENFSQPWQVSYEMPPSLSCIQILGRAADTNHVMEMIFPFVRYRSNLFNLNQIKKNISDKSSTDFKNFTWQMEKTDTDGTVWRQVCTNKGFCYFEGKHISEKDNLISTDRDLSIYGIGEVSKAYMRKVMALCYANDVNCTFFISPIDDVQLLSTEKYDNYIADLRSIADDYGVEVYDFNLIKDEFLDIKHDEYFFDVGHLNIKGSDYFTPVLWDVVSHDMEENEEKFYSSYAEKLENESIEVYGLYYRNEDFTGNLDESGRPIYATKLWTIASNRQDLCYRITKSVNNDALDELKVSVVIQDYTENNLFETPYNEHGVITIECINSDGFNEVMSFDY